MILRRTWLAAIATLACITAAVSAPETQEPQLSEEQMRVFLLNARVVSSRPAGKGIGGVLRLTLSDGKIVHDAAFQSIDEYKTTMTFGDGHSEINFRDSYKYDIAAYELAKILSLDDMMPVTVPRKWQGKPGALSWWLPVKMDEESRMKHHVVPPDPEAWNRQMYRMRVFSQLVYDTDRNLGNALISEDWHLWMIDFSRAFRLYDKLENAKNLVRCDRQLLKKLRQLDAEDVIRNTKGFLTTLEVKAVMQRRDRIVAFFDALVAQKGEEAVIY
jgi:hypothetical protein